MSMMVNCGRGWWAIRSKKDPRWDSGRREKNAVCVVLGKDDDDVKKYLENKEKELGEKPDDLELTMFKD